MSNESHNNKRLAKNTLILYVRMLFTVGISFYTTRVLLGNLGVEDYGLYNVVGGVVSMLYIVTTTLTEAISRFLTYGLGKNDLENLKNTFSTALNILLLFSLVVIVLGETVGLWFLNTHLNIDQGRYVAANWVYQFSLMSFVIEMCNIPFNSMIVAHEKMKAFAMVTIADVFLKLVIAYLLVISPIDTLIFYGLLVLCASIARQSIYVIYSSRNFEECRYMPALNKEVFVPIMKFAGFKMLSVTATMMATTGVNIVLNMFHGTVVNAAKGVASQLENYAGAFTKNFMMALNPQITKTYASNDMKHLVNLIYKGSTFSFLLLFVIAFPIICEIDFILSVWLKEIPLYTKEFIQYTLIGQLLLIVTNNVVTLNNAIGKIKKYEIISFCCYLMTLPVSWLLLKFNYAPTITVVVFYMIMAVARISAFVINSRYVPITINGFYKNVCKKLIAISCITVITVTPFLLYMQDNILRFIVICSLSTISIMVGTYFIALKADERYKLKSIIFQKLKINEKK